MSLDNKLSDVSRSLKLYEGRLNKLNIFTLWDLLFHLPFRYEDFSVVSPIAKLQEGQIVSVRGDILSINNDYTPYSKKIQKALITDETGTIEATWFNQPFLLKVLKVGTTVSLSGKVTSFKGKRSLQPTEYEVLYENTDPIHTGRLVPVYPETRGVSSKWLRRQIYSLLKKYEEIEDILPDEIRSKHNYDTIVNALNKVHFPANLEEAEKARERLAFDELLMFQLTNLKRREEWQQKTKGTAFEIEKHGKDIKNFYSSLPFELTGAQKRAVEQIFTDLSKPQPMNRLLQGDVGSGKTIVAATAMFSAFKNNMQSVLMAPTEILAEQHFKGISNILEPFGIRVGLVTGSKKTGIMKQESRIKNKEKSLSAKSIAHSENVFDILIGTHALLNEKITFDNLGLVVIDEQQRFGVEQRGIIRGKGNNPHLLTMTATPIPRTVALTMYGDLDLSYLDEMPKGRKIIKTWLVPPMKRDNAYTWIEEQIKTTDSQSFIICPFIEESENMTTVKAATTEFERLKKDVFPNLRLALLHGKQKSKEKDEILSDFKAKKYDILVATPVVEVGIDIPNATIIVIEASERFGLAQLHQLRGRVGRGDKQSYCLLFTESKNPQTLSKLKSMETTHVGAKLAELDLSLRGPGEMYGTAQSGRKLFKVASFSDQSLIEKARSAAEKLIKELDHHEKLKKKLEEQSSKTVTPD